MQDERQDLSNHLLSDKLAHWLPQFQRYKQQYELLRADLPNYAPARLPVTEMSHAALTYKFRPLLNLKMQCTLIDRFLYAMAEAFLLVGDEDDKQTWRTVVNNSFAISAQLSPFLNLQHFIDSIDNDVDITPTEQRRFDQKYTDLYTAINNSLIRLSWDIRTSAAVLGDYQKQVAHYATGGGIVMVDEPAAATAAPKRAARAVPRARLADDAEDERALKKAKAETDDDTPGAAGRFGYPGRQPRRQRSNLEQQQYVQSSNRPRRVFNDPPRRDYVPTFMPDSALQNDMFSSRRRLEDANDAIERMNQQPDGDQPETRHWREEQAYNEQRVLDRNQQALDQRRRRREYESNLPEGYEEEENPRERYDDSADFRYQQPKRQALKASKEAAAKEAAAKKVAVEKAKAAQVAKIEAEGLKKLNATEPGWMGAAGRAAYKANPLNFSEQILYGKQHGPPPGSAASVLGSLASVAGPLLSLL